MRKLGVLLASITARYLCSHVSSEAAKNKKQFTKYVFAINRLYIEMFRWERWEKSGARYANADSSSAIPESSLAETGNEAESTMLSAL